MHRTTGMHRFAAIFALAAAAAVFAQPQPQPQQHRSPPSIDDVMRRQDELFRTGGSVARMEITVTSPRVTRTLTMRAWTRGKDHALVVIEAPPREAGIATLRVGQNLWNHLPKIGRTIRVPPSMMLASWMGTDFTNDDLVKESSWEKDFDSKVDGWSESPVGWRIVATVKPGVVGRWTRVEMVITEDEWLPVRMLYFDRRGELARTLTFDEVKVMDGRRIPTHSVLVPADLENQRTEMRYLDADFDADIPESTFSLSELERRR